MAYKINVSSNVKEARASLRTYEKRQLLTATQRALNKTIDAAPKIISDEMRKHIAMKVGAVKKRILTIKAAPGQDKVSAIIKAEKIPNLASFKFTKPAKVISGKKRVAGKGIRARVWEKRKLYRGTFVWERNNSQTIFKRAKGEPKVVPKKGTWAGKTIKRGPRKGQPIKRQPIKPVWGADLAQVFEVGTKHGSSPRQRIIDRILAEFPKKLQHEISRIRRR